VCCDLQKIARSYETKKCCVCPDTASVPELLYTFVLVCDTLYALDI